MRTTIEIDDELLQEAMAVTGTKQKRRVVELALREVIRQQRVQRLVKRLGKTPLSLALSDLRRMREDD
jgi:Arc/MetJ family transcription regulator